LLQRLASIARERDYGRMEWSVLDWNEPAIGFYKKLGAVLMDDWNLCRLTSEAIGALADRNG
jgi:RimJ/RimL family protein N-acetyltransferase